ncbi:MAG: hypothetical protein EOO59_01710 [Hymenobacter sp.]|nr:MAG: hypothetical protein EOO59_01710 [Hymenobacter sp.]
MKIWIAGVATGLLLSLSSPAARAQVLRPGLLVLVKGDTLRGEIEDDSWDEEPTQVRFRPVGGQLVSYPAAAIKVLQLTGLQYFRREQVPLDRTAQTTIDHLVEGLTFHQQSESLLTEVLVDGPAQLLHTTVGNVQHYFVRRESQPFLELSERQYLRRQDGRLIVADGNNYRFSLQQYFGDCPPAVAAAQRAAFTPAGLAGVVQAYNAQCGAGRQAAQAYLGKAPNRRVAFNIGLVAGGRYAAAQLYGQPAGVLQGLNLDGQFHTVGGAYLDAVTPARRVALHVAALLATYGREGATGVPTTGSASHLSTRQTVLEVRLGLRRLWPLGQQGARLLVGTGITIPVGLKDEALTLSYSPAGYGTVTIDAPYTYPASHYVDWFYAAIPYLEAGVRQGRLTLLLDGRLSTSHTFYTDGYSGNYSYVPWYVGATVGLSLLRQQ